MPKAYVMNWMDGWTGHVLSFGALFAALGGFIPPVAALASAIWFAVQIYESRTYQHWRRNRMMRAAAKKLAKLKAKQKITLAEIAAIERIRHARAEANDLMAEAKAEAAVLLVNEGAPDAKT